MSGESLSHAGWLVCFTKRGRSVKELEERCVVGGAEQGVFVLLQCFSWLKLNFTTVIYFTTVPNFSNFRRELCQTLYTISHNEIGAVCVFVWATDKQQTGTNELLPNSIMASAATVGGGMQAWQHPFCDLFKHVDVDKWQQSDRAGNVTKVLVSPWPASLSPMHGRPLPKNLTGGSLRVCVCVCVC